MSLTNSLIPEIIPDVTTSIINSGFDVVTIPNITYWGDCSDTSATNIVESVNDVSQLTDRTSNGNHFAQGSSLEQPITNLVTQNGHNVIRFDGNDHFLERTGYSISPSYTIHMVANIFSVTDSTDSLISFVNSFQVDASNSSQYFFRVNSGGLGISTPPIGVVNLADAVYRLYTIKFDSVANTLAIFINGTLVDSVSDYTMDLDPSQAAKIAINRGSSSPMGMNLAELIIVNAATTTTLDADLFKYLKSKWDL